MLQVTVLGTEDKTVNKTLGIPEFHVAQLRGDGYLKEHMLSKNNKIKSFLSSSPTIMFCLLCVCAHIDIFYIVIYMHGNILVFLNHLTLY